VSAALQLLAAVSVSPPEGLSNSLTIIKAVLLSVTSFLGAVLLLLGVVMKKQRLAKQAAPSRAGASTTTVALQHASQKESIPMSKHPHQPAIAAQQHDMPHD
jgi:hypothetical protein